MINVALWVSGIVLLAVGVWRVRAPFARMSELDRLAENARRYEGWRGTSSTTAAQDGKTGADVMRQMLRRQVYLWAAVAIIGVALIVAGFVIR